MADEKVKVELELEISRQAQTQIGNDVKKTSKIIQANLKSPVPAQQRTLLETMMAPSTGLPGDVNASIRKVIASQCKTAATAFQTNLRPVVKATQGLGDQGKSVANIGSSSKKAESGVRGLSRALKDASIHAVKLNAAMGQAIGKAGMGATRKAFGRGGIGRRVLAGGATFVGGMLLGAVQGIYSEAIQNMQTLAQARLGQAPYMMQMGGYGAGGARFGTVKDRRGRAWAGGGYMGYNAAQAAEIQGRAARLGLGMGPAAGRTAMELQRGYGEGGIDIAAGIVRRGGTAQRGGASQAMKLMSQAMAVGIKTGLDDARIGEFLQAANDYAERQIEITPDKDSFKQYYRELAMLQERGGAGLRGKYGAAALGRIDTAIKGAGGAQQALMYRAFGFGQGASYFDVLRRQEQGIGGKGNLGAIMRQLRREYGAGEGGKLSQAGMVAFKNMGFGSTFMAEKLSKVYMQQQRGLIGEDEARKKVKAIEEKEAEAKIPAIQRRAYAGMAAFGGIAKMMARRFDEMATLGAQLLPVMQTMHEAQRELTIAVKLLIPLIKDLASLIKTLVKPVIGLGMIVNLLWGAFKGFGAGFMKGSGVVGRFKSAFAGMGTGFMEAHRANQKALLSRRGLEYQNIEVAPISETPAQAAQRRKDEEEFFRKFNENRKAKVKVTQTVEEKLAEQRRRQSQQGGIGKAIDRALGVTPSSVPPPAPQPAPPAQPGRPAANVNQAVTHNPNPSSTSLVVKKIQQGGGILRTAPGL